MRLAIRQALLARGKTGFNPIVGCIIVKNGKIVSSGFHKEFGGPHAEAVALKAAGDRAIGAAMFITLEPCSYYGKTPPCANLIVRSGIKEVFCACLDPNPLNSGKGIAVLKNSGIKISLGILRRQAQALNRDFFRRMKAKTPFVSLKLAQSLDGKIATKTGDSKWISSQGSRAFSHGLRYNHDAVMVGIGTVLKDDPLLNVRIQIGSSSKKPRQPVKIIIDSGLRTPVRSRLLSRHSPGKTIIAASQGASIAREKALSKKGACIIRAGLDRKRVDLCILMEQLMQKGINSILVEGGSEIAASMLESGLVRKLYSFICPIIIGGRSAVGAVGGIGAGKVKDAMRLYNIKVRGLGRDFLVEADVYRNN
jgi:diaminohydroxyphosphoribosylaminopyrimidine deaminase/5-amino-6-(5-phosphoribosylamino)uracil reductase